MNNRKITVTVKDKPFIRKHNIPKTPKKQKTQEELSQSEIPGRDE